MIESSKVHKILYGGDYNPEQWPEEIWKEDMRLFKLAHIDVVTLNVFSWAALQPDEITYDFSKLDKIMEYVKENGLKVCFATSTGAHPAWMARKYPDILRVGHNGMKRKFGARHNSCPNSPTYRKYSVALAAKLAERYKDYDNIVAWHISNEYGGECYCENCEKAFRVWLHKKYGTLDELNRVLMEKVDAEIGKIVDAIDKQNFWKNTVVIFTSDHGDGMGAHHWNQKSALYEEVVNIPLIVTLPGKKNAGKEMPQLVNNGVDFFAAVCDWAGIRLPEGLHGVSFRSLAEKADPSLKHQDYIVTETTFDKGGNTRGWALRTSRYKYVLYDKGRYREQLFDMEKDRGEMRNLAIEEKYKEILLQHREYLHDWMKLHHVAQIRKDVHTIPGVNPE